MEKMALIILCVLLATIGAVIGGCPKDDEFMRHCQCSEQFWEFEDDSIVVKCFGLDENNIESVLELLQDKAVFELALEQTKVMILKKSTLENFTIEHLEIDNSPLQSIEDGAVGSIVGLKRLYVIKTQLKKIPDISNANNLEELHVNLASIAEIGSDDIAESDSLLDLSIVGSNVLSIRDEAFYGLKNLETLDMHDNFLSELPKHLTNNQTIRYIDFSRNHIEEFPPELFKNDIHLEELHLQDNLITNLTESAIKNLLLQGTNIFLEANKLMCDSSLCWLADVLESNEESSSYIYGHCRYQGEDYIGSLDSLTSEDLECK